MAVPPIVIKAAVLLLKDDKHLDARSKAIGWVVVGILSPFIVLVAVIGGMSSGMASHNNSMVDLCFYSSYSLDDLDEDIANQVVAMRNCFTQIDAIVDRIISENNEYEETEISFDVTNIKAIFYALFISNENLSTISVEDFVSCFYTSENKTKTESSIDEQGNEVIETINYSIKKPISSSTEIYSKIQSTLGINVTNEDSSNAMEVYYLIKFGTTSPTYGDAFGDYINGLGTLDTPFVGADGFVEPVSGWQACVSSNYGNRNNPFSGKTEFHTGIDLAKGYGTPIYSVLDGTVTLVRLANTGYGNYVMVDHGGAESLCGSFVTLYAHCSSVTVTQGQTVLAGDTIALVGSTGASTGNHLHFEIRVNGSTVNPRSYLPS